jgi:DMSO/TMAO reductase YedYZ molybdopterin-dependent catalytic subunit
VTQPAHSGAIVKPTPTELMEDTGSGLDYGTRPDRMPGLLTPIDRFFVRSHAPTPRIDAATWRLRIDGDAVGRSVEIGYDQLRREFEMVSVLRTIECAGNRRVLFGEEWGRIFEGTQWGRGAISTAEWTGVRLRDVLDRAGVREDAVEVLAESLDEVRASRPLPMSKALAEDTLVVVAMNGEELPPDHGFPARLLVSGWLGAASIKWLGRLEVSRSRFHVPWNTEDYVLIGPAYPAHGPTQGEVITALGVSSLIELPWGARLPVGPQIIRGRAFAGEQTVTAVTYAIDDGPWRAADITSAATPGLWVRWQFDWEHATPGEHVLRVRAFDDAGRSQSERTAFNELGYMHESVVAHPVTVVETQP